MAKLDDYRRYVRQLLKEYAQRGSCEDGVEAQTIFDPESDRYQLIYVGWHNRRRVYGPVLHFDIKNEKIWIQLNGTEDDVATALMDMGVLREDIVLGFQSPHRRLFTEFAAG
jgi:XisI protein